MGDRIKATHAGAGLWDAWLDGKQVALGCRTKKRALYWAQRALDDPGSAKGGPTEKEPDRPYCKLDQSCCDFCCGN